MDELVVGGAEFGVDDADASDGALGAAGFYIFTYLEGVAGEDHNTAGKVGEGILNSQREGEADYAEEGDEGCYIDAHHTAYGNDDNGPHEDVDHLEEDGLEVVVDLHAAESLCEEAHQCLLDDETGDEGGEGIESAAEGDGAENAGDGCCVHFHCLLYILYSDSAIIIQSVGRFNKYIMNDGAVCGIIVSNNIQGGQTHGSKELYREEKKHSQV